MDAATMPAVCVPYPDSGCEELGNARASSNPNFPLSTQYMSFWSPSPGKAEDSKATLAGTPIALQLSH